MNSMQQSPSTSPTHAEAAAPQANRRVLLAGATGLVGRELLHGLLADDSVSVVHALGRRPLAEAHPKLTSHVVDFAALPALPAVDEVYLALGTTIKVAGSQPAFRAVDFTANLNVAKAALAAGAARLGLVSALGADTHSRVFYNRVKGELEDALRALHPEALVIAQPSLLVGDREALGQPARPGEKIAFAMSRLLGRLIPKGYRPIDAKHVAQALLKRVPVASGVEILASAAMQPE